MNRYRMYINGEQVEAGRGAWFPVYDPSTEEVIAEVPEADGGDIERGVETRAGSGSRMHLRSETCRTDAAHGTADGGLACRDRFSTRRCQHRHRVWRDRRSTAGEPSRRR